MANGHRLNLFSRDGKSKLSEVQSYFFYLVFSDRLKLEGANVINMDIPATNGVLQVVESIVEMKGGKS